MTETVRNYKELEARQKGIEVAKLVYAITGKFPKSETYGLASQMQRAAVSIPSNIAEGQAPQHTKEFRQFLYTALGSFRRTAHTAYSRGRTVLPFCRRC